MSMLSRNISIATKKRMFSSCNYEYSLSPFASCIIVGSLFTGAILSRIRSYDTQILTKLYEMEKDIKSMKSELETKK
jgi:hypothetical protein